MSGDGEGCFGAVMIVIAIAAAFGGYCAGVGEGRSYEQNAAVKSGHAEYYLDENNNRQWRWKPAAADR